MRPETHWLPGIIVLVSGLGLAALFILLGRSSRGFAKTLTRADERLDHEKRIQNALDALRDHAAEANRLPKEQFEAQKMELELAAARALKARDDFDKAGAKKGAKPAATAAAAGMSRGVRVLIWGGLTVAFFVVLGVILTQEERPRTDGMEATGKVPSEQGGQQAPLSAEEQEEQRRFMAAMERVKKNSEDVDSLAELAHALLRREQYSEADTLTERGIGVDPFHVETRVHRAMLRGVKGDLAGGVADLERLANTYPGAHEALLFAGAMSLELGDKKRALLSFERFMHEAPPDDQPPQIRNGVAALRAQLGE